ncbi:MAG: hypothetical protein OER87_21165, partial [Gammaproteobacteria bacterium]|nr:hypothetical protein [Gammaproteobacteria bacterium]
METGEQLLPGPSDANDCPFLMSGRRVRGIADNYPNRSRLAAITRVVHLRAVGKDRKCIHVGPQANIIACTGMPRQEYTRHQLAIFVDGDVTEKIDVGDNVLSTETMPGQRSQKIFAATGTIGHTVKHFITR